MTTLTPAKTIQNNLSKLRRNMFITQRRDEYTPRHASPLTAARIYGYVGLHTPQYIAANSRCQAKDPSTCPNHQGCGTVDATESPATVVPTKEPSETPTAPIRTDDAQPETKSLPATHSPTPLERLANDDEESLAEWVHGL